MINIIHIKHCKLLLCCKNQKHHDVSDNGIRCPSGTAITRLKNQGDADTGARYPQFNLNDDISGLTGIPSISSALSVYRQFKSSAPRGAQIFKLVNTIIVNTFQSTCPARGTTANMHNFFVQICARVTNIPLKGMPYLQKTYVSI